ncbi:MAG: bifunctional nuclease family protein [Bellilinea sp.]
MAKMVEVVIDSVRVSLTNQQRIVVLREVNAERYLPIWIGPYEAESITIALQEIEVARPQTHDLIKNLMNTLNARLVRVEVVALRDDVFFGNLVIEYNGQLLDIDTRPSDALALAVRAHVPIMASREVMETAAIIPDKDIQPDDLGPSGNSSPEVEEPETDERLSVFKDFLKNLNIDDLSEGSSEGDQNPDKDGPQKPT